MKLEEFLQENYNYNPEVKNALKGYIEQWNSWYKGNVKSFHNYFIYNGHRKVNKKRFTMNMAKEISEDWSDILWSERCAVSLKDENKQKQFNKLLDALDLNVVINKSIEKSGALGTCATVVSVYDIISEEDKMTLDVSNAKTRVDVVDVDCIYPISWNNVSVTECAFASVEYVNGKKTVVLSVHRLKDKGNNEIINHLFNETNGNLTEIQQEDIEKVFDTKSSVKWFSIFKPLLTNNIFNNSPFGIPHYANAIDNMKAVDISFDALKNEIKDSRRRTFVRAEMMNYSDGTQKLTFDPEDTDIYVLPDGANKDDLIQNDTTTLRTNEQIGTLNTTLNILGSKVGFGENHYHFDGTNLSTATAVVSSNSKMFRRKKKLEIGYESSIFDLIVAVCYASSEFGNYNIDTTDMDISFDDSIVEDKESESIRALREFNAGLISAVEYRERVFGETPEIAEQAIAKIKEEAPTTETLLGE